MDRARPKSKFSQIKSMALIAIVVVVLLSGSFTLANIDFSTHRVDRDKLSIETVQQGTMEVKVSANGQLLSRNIEQLAAQVAGRVAKKNVKAGAVVQEGQVLLELTDPDLIASAEESQSAWAGAVAELQASEAELQNSILSQEVVVTQAEVSLEKADLKTKDDRVLAADGIISTMELKRSELDTSQLKKTYAIEDSRLKKLRDNLQTQLAVKRSRVTELARALERAKTKAASLKVVAGISGIVQAIDVEVGQQLLPGSPIGRIAKQDQLYAELKVPARDATQVQIGQSVIVDTRNGTVNGIVTRVDPGVTDGTVVVDVDLKGTLPDGARPQLAVEGVLYISKLPNTLYVGKPSYVKNDASITVYKLDPSAHYATRVPIKAGKVSLNYMQVLQGLNAGDRIITSEIGGFQDQERILLK
ncbi:MAG TPA: HlyD family efflux transporter periplasmic adaptor subunit [Terriglobales bacterium]|jgi:multidrug resistance efflux pump|nr:HlyD family efflux transporter periplasmic adaptor subunit [Terriglobales bacterium]